MKTELNHNQTNNPLMKKLFAAALLVLICSTALAQNKVTGRVTSSEDGSPIPFASVVVKGTMNGVATDENGVYTITAVTPGAILEFSSVGFLTQEVQWDGKPAVNVILAPDRESLEEAMVVAYGTVKKGSYSGSAAVVKQESIKDAPVVSFEQVLAGKAPGVQVASYSGQPGSEADISIRGFGSFNAGNQPLYVIDGVPATSGDYSSGNISTSAMNFLNPSDIESITILKDAAAASLYGSRASNGVILITTKKGKAGKLTTNFKASAGFSYFAYNNYPLANDAESESLHRMAWTNYAEDNPSSWKSYGSIEAYVNDKVAKNYPAKDESKYIYKDWEDVLFRTGIAQNYELSLSGGGEKGKVYASVGWTDQQGVVTIDYLKRFSTTINAEANVNNWLKVGGTTQFSWQYQTGHQEGYSTKDNPFFIWKVVLNERWPYAYKDTGDLYLERWSPSFATVNPVQTYDKQINDAWQHRLILKGWAEVKFTDFLRLKSTVGEDWLYMHDRFGWLYGHPNFYAYSDVGGYMGDRHRNVHRLVSSTQLNFDKTWGEHHFAAMAAWEAEREKFEYTRLNKIDFSYMGATESYLASNFDDGYTYSRLCTLLSALGSVSYDYGARYYLTGTFRRDGSSKLAPETRWGNFWSVSASWRFSNEEFLKNSAWLSDGKIRGSYGTSGTLPSDYFGYMSVYNYTSYGSNGASYPGNLANSDLSWEKNHNWNVGMDLRLFDQVDLTVEYFNKLTTDLLLDASVPSTTGFTSTLMNIGSMVNRGWEIAVGWDILRNKNGWNLSVGANWSHVHNEILSLSEEGESIADTPHVWQAGYPFYQYRTRNYLGVCQEDNYMGNSRLKAGNPMYAEGSWYEKGETADQTVVLKNGTVIEKGGTIPEDTFNYYPTNRNNSSNMILEGMSAIPKGFGGFNLNVGYRGLTLDMAWSYKYGHYIWDEGVEQMENDGYYDFHRNIGKDQLNAWTPTNTNTNVPRRIRDNGQGGYYYSSKYLKKGDFLRLKNLTLSYNLPRGFNSKLGLAGARIYVAGTNLLTFSGLNIDPEIKSSGYYNYSMPAMRTVTLGLDLTF